MLQDSGGAAHAGNGARLAALVCVLGGIVLGLTDLGCSSATAGDFEPPPQGQALPPIPSVHLPYQGHWSYRFGDSPRTPGGNFVWSLPLPQLAPGTEPAGWNEAGPFRRFPGREGNTFLWMRTRLHGPLLHDGVMYVPRVDNLMEAYLDGQLVYRYGDMSGTPPYRFIGFRSHFIPIGTDYEGKTLTLRIYSSLHNLGPFGEPRLGERAEVTTDLFIEDLGRLVSSMLLILLGVTVLGLYLLRREERSYLMYGCFALSIGLYIMTQLQVRALISDRPLMWVHIELAALYIGFTFLCAFVEQVFGRGPFGLVRVLRIFHTVYTVGSAIVVAAGLVPLWNTLPPLQIVFIFDALYLTCAILYAAIRGNIEARIFAFGFVAASSITVYDLLGAMRLIPRAGHTVGHYGIAIFTLSLGTILARRFVLMHRRLRDYSSVLQLSLASVSVLDPEERTQVALDDLVRLLQARRALLFLIRPPNEELVYSAGRNDQRQSLPSAENVDFKVVAQARARQKPVNQRQGTVSIGIEMRKTASVMAAPLVARGQLLGVLYLEYQSGRRGYRDEDLDILLGLANQVAIAIVAARAMRLELESALTRQRFEEQRSLLDAAVRMASGDLSSPIKVSEGSGYRHLAEALEAMRRDLWSKLAMLETRNREIQTLNEELRRQIEQRSRRLMSNIMHRQAGKATVLATLEPGKLLVGRYRVHRQIGRGAMGAVYEVERTSDNKRFAAKLLSTRADKASLLRFTREAQILSRLSHRNLIGIADVDMTAGGVLFIVLELVSGGTLPDLRSRYGDTRWAMCVLRQISDALAAIHEAGIVHRDLKPGNVLIASERGADLPLIKLADFGVSLLTNDGSGPIPLGLPRKPSTASLRGATLTPPAGVPAAVPPTPSVTESLPPTAKLPGPELYSVGDDDDGADTSSLRRLDVDVAGVGLRSTEQSDLSDSSELMDTSPLPVVAAPRRASSRESADGVAASLETAESKPQRPSQGSLSRMLAAADESEGEGEVTSGLLTQTDTLIGTPMYMAPELWNTGSHRAEPNSDIFSIGVIAFELLTGRMPFGLPPVMSRANDEPIHIARLGQVRPDLEPRLVALVESCLSLNPDARLRASELVRRLIELGAQLPPG